MQALTDSDFRIWMSKNLSQLTCEQKEWEPSDEKGDFRIWMSKNLSQLTCEQKEWEPSDEKENQRGWRGPTKRVFSVYQGKNP
jgi:hypothetical protein